VPVEAWGSERWGVQPDMFLYLLRPQVSDLHSICTIVERGVGVVAEASTQEPALRARLAPDPKGRYRDRLAVEAVGQACARRFLALERWREPAARPRVLFDHVSAMPRFHIPVLDELCADAAARTGLWLSRWCRSHDCSCRLGDENVERCIAAVRARSPPITHADQPPLITDQPAPVPAATLPPLTARTQLARGLRVSAATREISHYETMGLGKYTPPPEAYEGARGEGARRRARGRGRGPLTFYEAEARGIVSPTLERHAQQEQARPPARRRATVPSAFPHDARGRPPGSRGGEPSRCLERAACWPHARTRAAPAGRPHARGARNAAAQRATLAAAAGRQPTLGTQGPLGAGGGRRTPGFHRLGARDEARATGERRRAQPQRLRLGQSRGPCALTRRHGRGGEIRRIVPNPLFFHTRFHQV
jgi:hypothetical protein